MREFLILISIFILFFGCESSENVCPVDPTVVSVDSLEVLIQPGDYREGEIMAIYDQIAAEVDDPAIKVHLVLLEGSYDFDEPLKVIPGVIDFNVVELRGHSTEGTIINLYHPHKPGIRFEGHDSVIIRDFQVTRIQDPQSQTTVEVIRIDDSDDLVIKNVWLDNNRSADGSIRLVKCNNPLITNNRITNYSRYDEASQKVIGAGIDVTLGYNITVEDNIIWEENPLSGSYFHDSAAIEVYQCFDVLIQNNNILNAGQQAIDTNGSDKVVVSGNMVDGSWGFGIKTANGSNITEITGNEIHKCGIAGVVIAPGGSPGWSTVRNVSITDNIFYETGQGYSLNPQTDKHYYFSGGYFQGNELALGVYLDGGIRNNYDRNCEAPYADIKFPTVKGVTVTGNDFFNNSAMGQYCIDNNGVVEQRCGDDNRKPPFDVTKSNNVVH